MKPTGKRLFLFRIILLLAMLVGLEAAGYLGMWLHSRPVQWMFYQNYFHIRAMLSGSEDPALSPRFLTLPYLGYIPFPNYQSKGIQQHNEDGYRGHRVPMNKTGKFRVLCLGGSTTYGFGVDSPSQTFPARLEYLLNDYIQHDSAISHKYAGAEVINAGLEAGTSAEEWQQYSFKYKYYHPDVVVVHSGINDALLLTDPTDFQLDYTHYRRINFHLEPLPQPMRWLMKSYFISFFSIQLFYREFSIHGDEFRHQQKQRFCKWTNLNIDSVIANKRFDYYPFYQNSSSLYREIIGDSARLIHLPNILNRNHEQVKSDNRYTTLAELNNAVAENLCNKFGGINVPFTFDSIKNSNCWVDDCHLNAEGEEQKARLLLPFIESMMR